MNTARISRRDWVAGTFGAAALFSSEPVSAAVEQQPVNSFEYCLNTSTIRGQKIPITGEIEIAAKAGYDSIEPWIRELTAYVQDGHSLKDLRKRIEDAGLKVASAIGFANWIVDDDRQRKQALETAKRDMGLLAEIGGTHIAAPPAGATRQSGLDLFEIAKRYRELLELGDRSGVVPQLELWGFSQTLSRLGEVLLVAVEAGHPDACVLPDVYHIYKGGSDFAGLKLLQGSAMHAFHVNDYPAEPARPEISDAQRVYPGDGIAPLNQIFRTLHDNGFRGALSLELFNRDYWKQDPLLVARTGLQKTRDAVAKALNG